MKTYLCQGCGRQAFKDPCKKLTDTSSGERPSAALGHWHCDSCGNKIKVKVKQ
jgi:DNA-directed RNA polymerase subunit RPC12/RpoP